ncbi:MAG: helix-turn-helix transcriptional regulator [Acholeplasmataceae bacterium]|jgi:transcriptional regulator with XRE-family HTH domain
MSLNRQRLIALRQGANLSRQALGRRAGIPREDVSRYEKHMEPSPDRLFALARTLAVHPGDLDELYYDPILYRNRPAAHPCVGKPAWLRDLCRVLDRIPEGELAILTAAAQAAVKKSTAHAHPRAKPEVALSG